MKRILAVLLAVSVATAAGGCVMKSEHDKVLGQLAATQGTLATTQKDLATNKALLVTTQRELTATKATLATTEMTLQTTKDALAASEASLKTTRGALATTEQAKAAVEARCALAEADNKRLRTGLTTLLTQCQAAAHRLKGAETALAELRTNEARMTTALTELKQHVAAQGTSMTTLEAAVKPLSGEIAELIRQAGLLTGTKVAPPPVNKPPVTPPAGTGGAAPKTP